jgi:hypothetical protein
MRSVVCAALLSLVLAPPAGRLSAADAPGEAADERTLKAAGLGVDGPALLEFFRKRIPTGVDRETLLTLLRQLGDNDFDVREQAAARLTALGPVAAPLLQQALKSPDVEVVRRAERCLKAIGAGPNAAVQAAAARLLAARRPEGAAEVLLAYLPFAEEASVNDEVRAALAAVALRDGKPAAALVQALTDKAPLKRAAAAEALLRAGGAGQRAAVGPLLKDADPVVRFRVARALLALQDKDAVPVLIPLLEELPQEQAWQVEDVLTRVAGDGAPDAHLGRDAAARKACRQAWDRWWRANGAKVDLTKVDKPEPLLGQTLVVQMDDGRVKEVDSTGKTLWQIQNLQFPSAAEVLPNDRVLIAEYRGERVTERDRQGKVVWKKRVVWPLAARRLPNGQTFIATRNQLLVVDRDGKEVFSHTLPSETLVAAQRLRNGQYAFITSTGMFVRLDSSGKEVKRFRLALGINFGLGFDVLANGRVLVPHFRNNKVVEYDADGKPVRELPVELPDSAVRLPNGNTLVASQNTQRVAEVDPQGKVVWEHRSDGRPLRATRR